MTYDEKFEQAFKFFTDVTCYKKIEQVFKTFSAVLTIGSAVSTIGEKINDCLENQQQFNINSVTLSHSRYNFLLVLFVIPIIKTGSMTCDTVTF